MEILEGPPLIRKDKGPIQEEDVPLKGEKEEEKEEEAPKKSLEPKHHVELKWEEEKVPQWESVVEENKATTKLNTENRIHIDESYEEKERTRWEVLGNEEKQLQHVQGEEGDHESPRGETQMLDWLENKFQKKVPALIDSNTRIEAILERTQIKMTKEKKPRVCSHIIVDSLGSRIVLIATLVTNKG